MENNDKHKIEVDDLKKTFELEDALIQLNRLSHFIEHEKLNRHEIFKKSLIINFHSYFLDNSYQVNSLLKRLNKKISLLNENEFQIDDPKMKSYFNKIWEDIFVLLDLFEEHITKVIKRFESGINTDFKIDILEYQKTNILREVQKLERPSERKVRQGQSNDNNNWFYDNNFSHDNT